ncbi:MAG: terpene cyclase/mutase family protein [Chloroflexi bacterium]|nr:terpene cyclase/mutase family protein [Chloroflexota bacterium]
MYKIFRPRRTIYFLKQSQRLPRAARIEYLRDHLGFIRRDPGIQAAIDSGIAWLCLAQDQSASSDGGVANFYNLLTGWGPSYPETTGYIIPTMLAYSKFTSNQTVRACAKRMLDWLVSIQFPNGSFQGGHIGAKPVQPTVFNTGQILLGLTSGVREFGDEYYNAMCNAADWLVEVQDPDGCWRQYESPFVVAGEKTYHTHVSWGLLEAARLTHREEYVQAALANIQWALTQQTTNGWFRQCCLDDPERCLTHTLGYALGGILEAYAFTCNAEFLNAGRKTADGCLRAMQKDGFLPGRLLSSWQGAVDWACLTGTVQIALCWLLLYQFTNEECYRDAAFIANRFVRRCITLSGIPGQIGGVKGSFPVDGGYGAFSYLSWACKFSIDSNMLEQQIREQPNSTTGRSG